MGLRHLLIFIVSLNWIPSEGQYALNEHSFDGEEDNGDRVVITTLDLSSWELYVLSDLSFKIASQACPNIDKSNLSKYQQFITEYFKKVGKSQTQHPEFPQVYSSLMRCIEYQTDKTGQNDQDESSNIHNEIEDNGKSAGIPEVEHSEEADWVAQNAILTPEDEDVSPTSASYIDNDEDTNEADIGILGKAFDVIRSYLFLPKSLKSVGSKEKSRKLEEDKIAAQKQKQKLQYKSARQEYANFFHAVSNILRKRCPANHNLNTIFIREAFLDMTTWATLDPHDTIVGASQYLEHTDLVKSLRECYKNNM